MSGTRRNREGFALLEAVVALAIVGLAAVTMLTTLAAELRAAGRAREALESHALAEAKLASLRLLPRDELHPLVDSLRGGRFDAPFGQYRWEASSRQVAGQRDLFEATVAVASEDGRYSIGTRLYRPKTFARPR
jgi:type II secretory pathway pseudopilin PulG